jgi:hypothetical protein
MTVTNAIATLIKITGLWPTSEINESIKYFEIRLIWLEHVLRMGYLRDRCNISVGNLKAKHYLEGLIVDGGQHEDGS